MGKKYKLPTGQKYIFTKETIEWEDSEDHSMHTLHRIIACVPLTHVKRGDLGGWIESEDNLSQEGNCWVYDDAKVYGKASVFDDAKIHNNAIVCGNAKVYGGAQVCAGAHVYGNANVFCYDDEKARITGRAKVHCKEDERVTVCENALVDGDAEVYGDSFVHGHAHVCGSSRVYGTASVGGEDSLVSGTARVYGNARVYGSARIYGKNTRIFGDNTEIFGNAHIYDGARVYDSAKVSGSARVFGNTEVNDNAKVYGNAWVYADEDEETFVYGNAQVYCDDDERAEVHDAHVLGNAQVYGNAKVYGDAFVDGDTEIDYDILNKSVKKYELSSETIDFEIDDDKSVPIYRIRALIDFGDIKKGDMGGFVESEKNLSQKGKCWIYDDAVVSGNAIVYGDAKVYDGAQVYGNAAVSGTAEVHDSAIVCDSAKVFGDADVFGKNVEVTDNAAVYGNATVSGDAKIGGNANDVDYDVSTGTITERRDFERTVTEGVIDRNKKASMFLESMINLGLDEAKLEAIVQIHNVMYPEMAIDEGVIGDIAKKAVKTVKTAAGTAAIAAALALGTPGNADASNLDNMPSSNDIAQIIKQNKDKEGVIWRSSPGDLVTYTIAMGKANDENSAIKNAMSSVNKGSNSAKVLNHFVTKDNTGAYKAYVFTAADVDNHVDASGSTERVSDQDQEGAKIFADQIKKLNGKHYAIGKAVSKDASVATAKASHNAATKVVTGGGKTGAHTGTAKIVNTSNTQDGSGNWVSYALAVAD